MSFFSKIFRFDNSILYLYLICVVLLSSCSSGYKKLLKSNDNEAKYKAAVEAYEQENYYQATQLFENLIFYFRGREQSEDINLYYGKSLMGSKDYYAAGYQFENFVRAFPYSPKAEEALFLSAYCKYMSSPDFYLDQTLTMESLKAFQDYLDKYPKSARVNQANKYYDELRMKIIKKDYTTAYNYYKVEQYQAAHVALTNFLTKYSDQTQYRQDAMYYIVLSGYYYAKESVAEKQKERWNSMILDYERYAALFENFTDKNKVEDLKEKYDYAKQQVEKLN